MAIIASRATLIMSQPIVNASSASWENPSFPEPMKTTFSEIPAASKIR